MIKCVIVKKFNVVFFVTVLGACGRTSPLSNTHEAWNQANSPWNISGSDMVTEFWNLPTSGAVAQKGWSDFYWPTYQGGISYRWLNKTKLYPPVSREVTNAVFTVQSPAEKYDLLLGRYDFPTVASERYRTRVLKTIPGTDEFDQSYQIPHWEGLCHGWAPAALNFKEPKRIVMASLPGNNTVVFYPSDIKALLMYYQQYSGNRSTQTVFAGERCNDDFAKLQEEYGRGEIPWERLKAVRESDACRDTNPATLHLALANEIGRAKRGFVVDITRDAEVWNQPVNSFASEIKGSFDGASPGAAPGTVKEVQVFTRMSYTVEVSQSTVAVGASEQTVEYEYVLELNDKGQVVGGRWISDSRPDFLWRQSKPTFQGYFRRIADLYQRSIAD
jgi:Transglutaminase elicitor